MTDQKALGDAGEGSTPDDVATLYSWANLHGAKYRDFSSSRAQAREEARLRVEEALAVERKRRAEEEERKAQEEAQLAARLAAEAAEAARQAEAERLAEIARQAEAERQAVLAAQEAQRQAAQQRVWQPPPAEAYGSGYAPAYGAPVTRPSESGRMTDYIDDPHAMSESSFMPLPALQQARYGSRPETTSAPIEPESRYAPLSEAPVGTMGASPAYQSGGPRPPADWRREMQPTAVVQTARPTKPLNETNPTAGPQRTQPNFQNSAYSSHGTPKNVLQERPTGQVAPAGQQLAATPLQGQSAPLYPTYSSPAYAPDAYTSPSYAVAADSYMQSPWLVTEQRELRDPAPRPAWLAPELPQAPPPAPSPVAPQMTVASSMQAQYSAGTLSNPKPAAPAPVDDTLVGSRDRMAGRWYALKSVFDPSAAPVEQQPMQNPARVPVLAVFSLAGGVGKTSIVAALGRALSSRGERVLLVDTATYGLLPFFFGARDQRPGQLRTFNPPMISSEAPIQLVTLDPDGNPPAERSEMHPGDPNQGRGRDQDWLLEEIGRYSRGSSRIVVDLPTASGATTRRVLRMAPVVLVPVVPDMSSVVSVSAIESFFQNSGGLNSGNPGGRPGMPYYVLNQFDPSLPLHLDVREILREQIGDRLLPFALRRNPVISEALAEGMTVMDYAPTATVAEDYASLAGWVRGVSAPAVVQQRGVRWSER